LFHFENSYQFKQAGIELKNVSTAEILESVKDMIAWLADPTLTQTDLQARFSAAVEAAARRLVLDRDQLELPIADYLGISLPGYRISPSVAALREPGVAGASAVGNDSSHDRRVGSRQPADLQTAMRPAQAMP
jgi:hypothetical protein